MKKVIVIFLTFIYTVSTAGVTGSNFYCCGKFKETGLFSPFSSKKGCKQDAKDDGCCNTKMFFVKVSDQHSLTTRLKVEGSDVAKYIPTILSEHFAFQNEAARTTFYARNTPPIKVEHPLYLLNSTFLI